MGQLVVAAAGAAVGAAFPAIGISLGWTAGSILGSLLFGAPDKVQRVQGPTLNDGRVFGTEYGQAIVWGLGTFLNAGQIIWNSDRVATVSTTQTSEGGGGKGNTPENVTITTTTTYTMDMLVLLNDDLIAGVGRIWDNGKLGYNPLDGASMGTLLATDDNPLWERLTVYTGDPAQLPDPDYEAAIGVGNVPAYRHRGTVYIKGLKLGQAPAPVRNLTFEVVRDGTVNPAADAWTFKQTVSPSVGGAGRMTAGVFGGSTFAFHGAGSSFISNDDGFDTWTEHTGMNNANANGGGIAYGASTFVTIERVSNSGFTDLGQAGRWSADAQTWTFSLSGTDSSAYGNGNWTVDYSPEADTFFAVHGNWDNASLGAAAARKTVDHGPHWSDNTVVPGNIGWIDIAYGNNAWVIVTQHVTNRAGGALSGQAMCCLDDNAVLNWVYGDTSAVALRTWSGVCYAGNDTFVAISDQLGTQQCMRSTDRGQTWVGVEVPVNRAWQDIASNKNGIVVAVANTGTHNDNSIISFDYGATWQTLTFPGGNWRLSAVAGNENNVFACAGTDSVGDPDTGAQTFFTLTALPIATITPEYPTYEEAFRAFLERCSLVDGVHFNVSGASTITKPMRSYPVSQIGPGRAPIDVLASTGYADVICTDMIRVVPRGGASVVTIPFEDLGAGLEGEDVEPLAWRFVNDMESPAYRSATYRNVANDYLVDTQQSDRLVSTLANTVRNDQIPQGMIPSEMKEVVDVWGNDQVNSIMTATVCVLGDYAYLQPADVITVTDRAGNTFRCRITKIEDVYPVLKLDIIAESASITTAEAITDENYDESATVDGRPLTDFELLDIPILQDAAAASGAPYVVGKGADTPWPGFALYQSANGVDYTALTTLDHEAVIGACTTTLGTWTGARMFDEKNKLRVNIGKGNTLTSATHQTILDSQATNACLVGSASAGWEFLQFRDATVVSDGIYDLTGLLRGGRGTEWAMAGHGSGETFVLLTAGTVGRIAMANSQLGLSFDYKGVTFGKTLASATAESFTCNGVALKPFSPVDARCSRDGSSNATITFRRRTRLSVRMIGELGINVPLGEGAEQYEIDVYATSGFATIVATIESTSETVSFTAADQTGVGLTPGDPLYLKIYQMSSAIGRGRALQATV